MLTVFLIASLVFFNSGVLQADTHTTSKYAVLEDFDRDSSRMGTSVKNILDNNQWITAERVNEDASGKPDGKAMLLSYDVASYQPAVVRFWITLSGRDLSTFDCLHLSIKSDPAKGGSKNIKIQIIDGEYRRAPYILTGITHSWKSFQIPFKKFPRIRNWSAIREITFILDDVYSVPKEGVLFIDEIYVTAGSC